jgi:hypothetical protein
LIQLYFDIKLENILYKVINADTILKYIINDKEYYIPTYGYLFMIGDFGISSSRNILKNISNNFSLNKDSNTIIKIIRKKLLSMGESYNKIYILSFRIIKK